MTDELKPCLAHPCDGAMKANLYDASLTCSKCQFQVADESEYSALVAGKQAAIDAALKNLQEELNGWRHAQPHDGVFRDVLNAIDRLRCTNPIAELERELAEARKDAKRWKERAEWEYGKRAYPTSIELAFGALDAAMKTWVGHNKEQAIDAAMPTEKEKE